MGWLPPATPLSFSSWALWGIVFNYWIMRRFHGWWHRYNYITAAGLDAGLIISTIVIFFAITFHEYSIPWWGNEKPFETTVSVGWMGGCGMLIYYAGLPEYCNPQDRCRRGDIWT
jgi:hypothetical protein